MTDEVNSMRVNGRRINPIAHRVFQCREGATPLLRGGHEVSLDRHSLICASHAEFLDIFLTLLSVIADSGSSCLFSSSTVAIPLICLWGALCVLSLAPAMLSRKRRPARAEPPPPPPEGHVGLTWRDPTLWLLWFFLWPSLLAVRIDDWRNGR
jgi:hypothetical protein